MADSLFLNHNLNQAEDEQIIKSKTPANAKRPHNTMVVDKSTATLLLNPIVTPKGRK